MSNLGTTDEKPPLRKKPNLSCPFVLSSLPDEVALSCLCRVSRLDHPSLSLASKWHCSLLISPELYDVRSLMGYTENFIYLCLRIPLDPNPRWFAFSPKTLNCRLFPIRSNVYQPPEASAVVSLGYGIYVIGGRIRRRRSSSVLFLDCRSHTWSTLPSMGVARSYAATGVVDGKIYVFGGCEDPNSPKWGEVFDPKTQTWDALPMPPDDKSLRHRVMYESTVMEKKIHAVNKAGRGFFYIPSEGIWKRGKSDTLGYTRGWYVIENVMYCCVTGGRILWCDAEELECREPEAMEWREVKGLEALKDSLSASKLVNYSEVLHEYWESCRRQRVRQGLPARELEDVVPGHKLSNSGPNMLLFWDVLGPERLEIWCAQISLERRKEMGQIFGKVEWSEPVMTLDSPPLHQQHYLLLNDGSKHINVVGWRKNSTLSQRVETSRRRSRRCLLMRLALANSPDQESEIHELLALVYYDSLQSVVPFYDHRKDWSHAFYMGKLSEKLGHSYEIFLSYYEQAMTLNPLAVDPVYRIHASRLKLLNACGKQNLDALKSEFWSSSFEDPSESQMLEAKWRPVLSKIKNVLISNKVLEENLEIANSLLKSCYNFFRETVSVTLPSEINLYLTLPPLATAGELLPGSEGVEVIDVSIPRKLLWWAYTLFHGHCGSISQVIKYMEENTKPKMKRGASTSSVVPSVQPGGNSEPEAAPRLVQAIVPDSLGEDSFGSTSAPL